MVPVDTILMFIAASVALALAPGPDNIFVLTQSALYGRRTGILVTLGLCTGLVVHTMAVSLGVAVIFQTSALAFNILKIIGAAYLIYLAFQAFRAGPETLEGAFDVERAWYQLYSRGIIMNLTNPKVAIFFLAFLPQFADPSVGAVSLQILMLGGIFIVLTLLIFGVVSWFAGFIGQWLKGSVKAQVIMNRVAGTVFMALAVRLAVSER